MNIYKQRGSHMKFDRASGIILHPTSLSGRYGIGDLGSEAFQWIDFLIESGIRIWQVLPLGPTGFGDSPYQCFSAFAGNPYIISPDKMLAEGLLAEEDLADHPDFPSNQVDFGTLIPWKLKLLDRAYQHFNTNASAKLKNSFSEFQSEQGHWLDDFALFMALKEAHQGAPWPTWEAPLRDRHPQALGAARQKYQEAIQRQIFRQFVFFSQWSQLRQYANERNIKIIGDVPIFVAHDSADVWAHPELFYLDQSGNPTFVAGVPPDYFSPTGQLWGNPLYRWEVHARSGYSWWIARLKAVLQLVDIIRLDHFRGFVGYWEIPAGLPTAEIGRWVPGPAADFFNHIQNALGDLPLIAEDLGVITPDVVELRERFQLPGMKIFQFAFSSDATDRFLPHNYPNNCVTYTGTHDNDTSLGWYRSTLEEERDFLRRYLGRNDHNIVWEMMRAIWSSVAMFAIVPMQDVLNLGTEARMNFPGRPSGNWSWRMPADALTEQLKGRILEYNQIYGRCPWEPEHRKSEEEDSQAQKTA
jgi:4-alpha-glucanotransferase